MSQFNITTEREVGNVDEVALCTTLQEERAVA